MQASLRPGSRGAMRATLLGRRIGALALLAADGLGGGEAGGVVAQLVVGEVAALALFERAAARVVLARMVLAIPMRHLAEAARRGDDRVAAGEAVGADVARGVDAPVDAEERLGDRAAARRRRAPRRR